MDGGLPLPTCLMIFKKWVKELKEVSNITLVEPGHQYSEDDKLCAIATWTGGCCHSNMGMCYCHSNMGVCCYHNNVDVCVCCHSNMERLVLLLATWRGHLIHAHSNGNCTVCLQLSICTHTHTLAYTLSQAHTAMVYMNYTTVYQV